MDENRLNAGSLLAIIIKMKSDHNMHEDDEVIAEFDVCISGALSEHLQLL